MIPEHKTYKPGEIARFQVRTPFREATALVSVEAGGIIETFVQPLSRFKPTVELPVKAEWGPNASSRCSPCAAARRAAQVVFLLQWGWREPRNWFKEWWNPDQPTAMVDLANRPIAWLGEIHIGTDGFGSRSTSAPTRPITGRAKRRR